MSQSAETGVMPRDYYEVLLVERTADDGAIKKAYRKLAIKYHPDRSSEPDAQERFKEATEAFEVLSDADKRARYDRHGHDGLRGMGGGNGAVDLSDVLGDLFGGIFGGGGRRRRGPQPGPDVRAEVELTLEDTVEEQVRTISISRHKLCTFCGGSGDKPGAERQPCNTCAGHGIVQQHNGPFVVQTNCPRCHGAGKISTAACAKCDGAGRKRQTGQVEVTIPPGIADGMRMRIPGEGDPSEDEHGPPGDLYLDVSVASHPLFERIDDHLLLEMPISIADAALGAKLEIPTLRGDYTLHIAAGTQSGELLRVGRKGFPNVRTGRVGDLVVKVEVDIPATPSKAERKALEALREASEDKPSRVRRAFREKLVSYRQQQIKEESSTRS